MKSIELTEEHRSKLLEMCNSLFPEYKIQFSTILSTWKHINELEVLTVIHKNNWKSIHWFEFCMTHLARSIGNSGKIFNDPVSDSTELLSSMIMKQEWSNKYHPVDYLYELWKQHFQQKRS